MECSDCPPPSGANLPQNPRPTQTRLKAMLIINTAHYAIVFTIFSTGTVNPTRENAEDEQLCYNYFWNTADDSTDCRRF